MSKFLGSRGRGFNLIEILMASVIGLLVIMGSSQLLNISQATWQTAREVSNFNNELLVLHQLIYKGFNTNGFFPVEPPPIQGAFSYTGLGGPTRLAWCAPLANGTGIATFSVRCNAGDNGQLILRHEASGTEFPVLGNPVASQSIRIDNWNFTSNHSAGSLCTLCLVATPSPFTGATNLSVAEVTTIANQAGAIKRPHFAFRLFNDADRNGIYNFANDAEYGKVFHFVFSPRGEWIY